MRISEQALYACGKACPRDADQQAAMGRPIDRSELRRGDLVCWEGHIGMMLDEARLLHASSNWMATTIEPLADVIARNEAAGRGGPTGFRRLPIQGESPHGRDRLEIPHLQIHRHQR